MKTNEFIFVHTCAGYDAKHKRVVHLSFEAVRRYHMLPVARYDEAGKLVPGTGGRGFKDIGYQEYIERDGRVRIGRLDTVAGAHTQGLNDRSIGICVSGHGDFERFNPAQMASLVARCAAKAAIYSIPVRHVLGHREAPAFGGEPVHKSCPGTLVDMDQIRELVRATLAGTLDPATLAAGDDDEGPPTRREGRA